MHAALADGRGAGGHVLHAHRVVDDGLRVRHAAHRREAAVGRGARAGGDVLLLLQAGLAQMHVHVHQAGHHYLAAQVAFHALRHGQAVAHFHDAPVAHQHLARLVQAHLRVDHVGVLKQQGHLRSLQAAGTGRPCG